MQSPYITRIQVDGMHGQFNVDIQLKSGLNVLYGQNGRGKTTLLHLIANTLELDFDRFKYLRFELIDISVSNGSVIKIRPEKDESGILVSLDGNELQWREDGSENSNLHRRILRSVLGNRPNYLPAFRSILERVRNDSFLGALTPSQQQEFDKIRIAEARVMREDGVLPVRYPSRTEGPSLTAQKTLQCRQWFGGFSPIIRYPSIGEVTDKLETEFRDAELETAAFERRMFSDFFLGTMRALLSGQDLPSEQEVETLLQRIRTAVVEEESNPEPYEPHGPQIIHQLAQAVDSVAAEAARAGAAERRVLRLYADMLEQRGRERRSSFEKIKKFETAVNKFLDNKTLHIAEGRRYAPRSRSTYVESENYQQYPLTSLSSGERQVLTMLFSASRLSAMSGSFLIDEPELSLHIDWQRIVLAELMAQAGGRQIIACTHSPEVGADHIDAVQVFNPIPYRRNNNQEVVSDSLLDDSL
ncbi:AAA family ATPase [Paracidovorax valerianellae]|uniref:Predicted ATP-binding protein involved in virulence n=1 Tax=Paracidovorax valerianellae TaxID=187868 RepID=A0A1G7DE99_9BURK|nr:AAA family ATPase [Paracidovorax valerianellae]MDA8446671.1 ATP-binding protein [Paracidovorax valerianellae]SDE49851.1 Predicted ATP-binding protein involved in virulence [Paracidovorax valerianellae]